MSTLRIGIAALSIALLAAACGGSNNATGQGGTSGAGTAGTTGDGGTTGGGGTAGGGGSTGDAGTTGAGGTGGSIAPDDGGSPDAFRGSPDASAPYPAVCAATVRNKGACVTATD